MDEKDLLIKKLSNENRHLKSINFESEREIERLKLLLKETNIALNDALKKLDRSLEKDLIRTAREFMPSSEKSPVINEAEKEASHTFKEMKKRGRKVGFSFKEKFDNLSSSIIRETITIPIDETNCKDCDTELKNAPSSKTYKVEIIPSKIKVIEFNYLGKECPICSTTKRGTDERDIYPDSALTASLASELLVNKYVLGIPLYRMEDYYFKHGLTISRKAMADYLIKVGVDLEPLYELMKHQLINNRASVVHCDETTLNVIKTTDKNRRDCFMWVYATSFFDVPIYLYEFQESREAKHVKNFLSCYEGYIVTDGYQVYRNLDNIKMAACWAHVRRKFFDIIKPLKESQKLKSNAYKAILIIDKLFKFEREYRERMLTAKEIKTKRSEYSLKIVDEYETFIDSVSCEKPSALGKAIEYSKNLMPNLKVFLEDGHIEISNNLSERAVKPFVIARKNFLFSYSLNGAYASAINFSIIQTARSNGLDVKRYLEYVISELPITPLSSLPDLLPFSEKMRMFRVSGISR